MKCITSILVFALFLLNNCHFGGTSLYLSLTDMEDLLDAEKAMIDGLEQYIEIEERRVLELKLKFQKHQNEYIEKKNQSESHILNPINAYLLTKHLTQDWKKIEDIMIDDQGGNIIKNVVNKSDNVIFPTEEDLEGAAVALIRLQKVYNLNAQDVANGLLNGINFNKELSANDCFQIGKSAYNDNDFERTVHWMTIALEKLPLQETDNIMMPYIEKSNILEYLAFSIYKTGDIKTALKRTKELLDLSPDHKMAKNNIYYFEKEMEEMSQSSLNTSIGSSENLNPPDYNSLDLTEKYELLCRGDVKITPSEERKLKCFYTDNNIPYLKIGPLKCEEAFLEPKVLIFYDILYDSEIEQIKMMAKPRLNRAGVFGDSKPKIRVSKTSWIYQNEYDESLKAVIRRAGFLSQLDMRSSEALQICNYGIGGHYEPHVDYSFDPEAYESDRTGTILFYMTDVQQGGATVFTELKRTVWPKKGSAVYWHNMYDSGEGNPNTRHASCPVLIGNKWVANLWVHSPNQVCWNDYCNDFVKSDQSIELLKMESDIISGLEKYINDYENQLERLKSNLADLQKEHEEANEDVTRYLSNPINAYLLTKRLTTDWKHVESIISEDEHLEFFKNLTSNFGAERLPNEEDLRNEILRLDHLRKTYDLPIADVANGYLDGVKYSEPLKAVDCFEIGRQLYYANEFQSSKDWLELAIKKFDYGELMDTEDGDLAKASILDYYSMAHYELGNYDTALNLAGEAVKLYPEFDHIKHNIRKIRRAMMEEKEKQTTAGVKKENEPTVTEDEMKYEKGCRGDLLKSPAELKNLYCENYFGESAFLKLAPFKLEVLNLKPKIVLVHDILYENEIEKLINITKGQMSTATLLEQYKGVNVAYPTLESQYYMVENSEISLISKLNQRFADVTGLIVNNEGENLQISKYSVGMHLVPPTDYLFKVDDKPIAFSEELGNRMASVVVYLNHVEKGGATLFPSINTIVKPVKGAALFWYNILPSGAVDFDVRHIGCPVLKGKKWVLMKWIREKDQIYSKLATIKDLLYHFRILSKHRTEYKGLLHKLNQTNEIVQSMALYKFLSKFNKNLYQLEDIVEYNPEIDLKNNVKVCRNTLIFPTKDDLTGVISGLVRLQDVYDLTVDKFFKSFNFGDETKRSKLDFTDYYLIEDFRIEKEHFEITKRQEFILEVFERYKQGCRNELKRKINLMSKLQCWYLSETSFFLQYAPVKIEEINFSPEIFLFHDVIYDSEIKKLQNLSKGKLTRAKVYDITKNSEYKSEIRTNKLAWLKPDTDPLINVIRRRIAHITGLSMDTAEDLQIANYGIGGHYEPHLDYHFDEYGNSTENFLGSENGNRMATLVFYLSDVKAGGATVFPLLNITVFPQKGSALFWYNLYSNGAGDVRTFHAACPVLEGDKWILNEWIHERDQEFNRPCLLQRDDI
ncbi:uncharacterized protein LOC129611927 [Condylostylus longicornis]|uniref:uncharacterized protein LOC129611927 n=1 Tax=Condylostylus longicornis TaxID=2530218 RepID=UPI00244E5B34|nr:uncharacterized protein LOC129611927 [Condylostylus longicornis]